MRLVIILLISIVSFWQAQASSCPSIIHTFHISTQTEHHSKPVNPKQENQEEDDLADEDEDFSDESYVSWDYNLIPFNLELNTIGNFYLVGKSNAHINPISTPPDSLC
jgi:hypothetical protein